MQGKYLYMPWILCGLVAVVLLVLQGILLGKSYEILFKHFTHDMILLYISSLVTFMLFIMGAFILVYSFNHQRKINQIKMDFYTKVSSTLHTISQSAANANNPKQVFSELRKGENRIQAMLFIEKEQEGFYVRNVSEFNIIEALQELKNTCINESTMPLTIRITDRMDSPLIKADKEHLIRAIYIIVDQLVALSPGNTYIQLITEKKNQVFSLTVEGDGVLHIKQDSRANHWVKADSQDPEKENEGQEEEIDYVNLVVKAQNGWIESGNHFGQGNEISIYLPQTS